MALRLDHLEREVDDMRSEIHGVTERLDQRLDKLQSSHDINAEQVKGLRGQLTDSRSAMKWAAGVALTLMLSAFGIIWDQGHDIETEVRKTTTELAAQSESLESYRSAQAVSISTFYREQWPRVHAAELELKRILQRLSALEERTANQ
jgi:hypothetical protein